MKTISALCLIVFGIINVTFAQNPFGGPDAYGYTWRTQNAPGGPTYQWIDLPSIPGATQITGLTDDNAVGPFSIGFMFEYYGKYYNAFHISSNGHLRLGPSLSSTTLGAPFPTIPGIGNVNTFIAPMATDLLYDSTTTDEVWYWISPGYDSLIVSWLNVPFWSNNTAGYIGANSFQVILERTSGAITFQYAQQTGQPPVTAGFCSVGIESDDGTSGLNPLYDQFPLPGTVIRITKGDYNLVRGQMYVDVNSNNVQDVNEPLLKYKMVVDQLSGKAGLSDATGWYTVPVEDSSAYSLLPPYIQSYSANPVQYNGSMIGPGLVDSSGHFIYQPDSVFDDLSIQLSAIPPFRPGFQVIYSVLVSNMGTDTAASQVTLRLPAGHTFVSSNYQTSFVSPDSIILLVPAISPFSTAFITAEFTLSSSVPIGTVISANATVWAYNDVVPVNNDDEDTVLVSGSFDPNDILVDQTVVDVNSLADGVYLYYKIRFQNTGNDTAFHVSVVNRIPSGTTLNSFEWLGSTHPALLQYEPDSGRMIFDFPDILLPDSSTDEPASHGYLCYRIRLNSSLQVGDSVENSAAIYFDFNAPVITNQAQTLITTSSGLTQIEKNMELKLFPNPSRTMVSFRLSEIGDDAMMYVYDGKGLLVKKERIDPLTPLHHFYLNGWPAGVYQVRVMVGKHSYGAALIVTP